MDIGGMQQKQRMRLNLRRLKPELHQLIALCILTSPALAGEPTLRNLNLRGVEIGAATTVVVDGDELGTAPRLFFPLPRASSSKPAALINRRRSKSFPMRTSFRGFISCVS